MEDEEDHEAAFREKVYWQKYRKEKEQREEERKNYDVDYQFPIMAWVTELIPGRLYIGPMPKTEENVGYLVHNMGVSMIFSLLRKDRDLYYMDHFKHMRVFGSLPLVIPYPFDESRHTKKGNTKKEQLENKALFYVDFAKSVLKMVYNRKKRDVIYIHHSNGNMEEVFIGFTVWLLLGEGDVPKDPVQWIVEHDERLLDDDSDNKELLMAIWKKAKELKRANTMFFSSKKKKQKTTEEGLN